MYMNFPHLFPATTPKMKQKNKNTISDLGKKNQSVVPACQDISLSFPTRLLLQNKVFPHRQPHKVTLIGLMIPAIVRLMEFLQDS